jgi:DNA-directed RNA polymerase specialized sigma24 family protein
MFCFQGPEDVTSLYSFSYYTKQDIKQEVWVFCLEALPKYDEKRKLEGFLYIHARNRVLNLLRDKYYRTQCPCKKCLNGEEHVGTRQCKSFLLWQQRNNDKAGIADLSPLQDVLVYTEHTAENNELVDFIDEQLPPNLREYYLRLKSGEKIAGPKIKQFIRLGISSAERFDLCLASFDWDTTTAV